MGSRSQKQWQPKQHRLVAKPVARKSATNSIQSALSAAASDLSSLQLGQSEWDIQLRQRALAAAQDGNYEEAIALFSQLLKRNPDSAHDYNNRGLAYFQSGQLEQAIADYDRALDLNPCLDSVYNNRANYYASQGRFLDAILDYDLAIELNPGNVRAWINQGITFRDVQMYEQAIECFELALCFNQLEGHVYAERGRTYHLWGDWNYALADYDRALSHLTMNEVTSLSSTRLRSQIKRWQNELLQNSGL
ncbi:MAG TPA: tetratricopeptide repeat protein [Chroococcidiopsis sp.]